ncbi:thiamine pyrophosphate-dependent enzyme [Acidisphaera sp. L21]|uniref:thiamine pyrophosphate-dependent enzyme n=1 Tax=Acidisphaera sp. L21 TaxID=1641851 RepID=UPI00131C268F|nr:thiamine pyrophosphate-dependent enzyme [Acidisphaera sp. L21]
MSQFGTLDRRETVAVLLADRGELLVVCGLGSPTYDVFAAGDHDANFYLWGAMGGAALIGLGLALAQPNRPVAVVTGDGEALMGVGGLLTIAVKRPPNLSIVVLDNGHFGETGMQMSHSGHGVDLAAIATSAGFGAVSTVTERHELAATRTMLHDTTTGPRLVRVRIAPGETPRALPARDGVYLKNRFRQSLGYAVS